jgi:hypothetical protein
LHKEKLFMKDRFGIIQRSLAAGGTLALVMLAAALLAPKTAHALVAALVQVSNTPSNPVPVTEVGTRQPYQYTCFGIPTDQYNNSCSISVPAGKRFVALSSSASILTSPGVGITNLEVQITDGGFVDHYLTVSPPVASSFIFSPALSYKSAQPILAYVEPAGSAVCIVQYNSPSTVNLFLCTLSGYLVDVP